jgi:hypothetical protein
MAGMKLNDVLLGVLITLIVIIFAYHAGWMKKHGSWSKKHGGSCDGFAAGEAQQWRPGAHNPYTVLNKQLDSVRGYRHDGYNQAPLWRQPHGLDRYHRAGAHLRPEQIAEAEREQWFAATEADQSGGFNTELTQDAQTDTMQYHTSQPGIDYSGYITDLVVDPRTRDNHQRWAEEMKPWSGTAMMVDDLDEAMEAGTDFVGLRRPQAIVQHNPLQLTERDTNTFSSNAKFNFKG